MIKIFRPLRFWGYSSMIRLKRSANIPQVAICSLFAVGSLWATGQAPTPSESAGMAPTIRFSVVSVKENRSDDLKQSYYIPRNGDSITYTNFPLFNLVIYSNDFHRADLVFGLPEWTKNERFDIVAKVAPEDVEKYRSLTAKQRMAMFQAVLADRFKLKFHVEPKELPALALTVAKGGGKLSAPDPSVPLELKKKYGQSIMRVASGTIEAEGATMADLASLLTAVAHKGQFVDQTGMAGRYDFKLNYAEESESESSLEPEPLSNAPDLSTALREQLGIQLKPVKAILDCFIVDRIEHPTPN